MSVLGPARRDVHVRWAALPVTDEELETLEPLLSPDEHRRAARYLIPAVQRRFIGCRAILRTLLGEYLGIDPGDVELEYGQAGKPRLAADLGSDLRFNLAHSGRLAAFAFCQETEIGIDIEHVDRAVDATAIVATMFTASERDRYHSLPDAQKRLSFYLAWTRNEAYLKGVGCGLTGPLAEMNATDAPGPQRFAVAGRAGAHGWSIEHLRLDDGWVGAVAVQREEWQLKIQPMEQED
jgi:4'-phosphopantetheinyl transferase